MTDHLAHAIEVAKAATPGPWEKYNANVRYTGSHLQGSRVDTIEDFRTRFVEAGEHRG